MTNVRANCRERFAANDLEFIAKSLSAVSRQPPAGQNPERCDSLAHLLSEPNALDSALDSDQLLKALLESPTQIPVSPQFYFYVLTRHMLMRFDRDVADYVACVLSEFAVGRDRWARRDVVAKDADGLAGPPYQQIPCISDMLIALRSASSEREFMIRVQVGDYSLFLSGIFPQHIAHRSTQHASPPLSFYEEVGSQNYRRASDHRLAREQSLVDTYRTIAERFSEVRVGLNQMSDRLLCLEGMQ